MVPATYEEIRKARASQAVWETGKLGGRRHRHPLPQGL